MAENVLEICSLKFVTSSGMGTFVKEITDPLGKKRLMD